MRNTVSRNVSRILCAAGSTVILCLPAAPQTATTLTATDSGWFDSDGSSVAYAANPHFGNYAVGWDPVDFSDAVALRDFFVFDLTGVSGTIVSATLNLYMPAPSPDQTGSGYLSYEPSEPYQLTSTSTSIANLTGIYTTGSSIGLAIFKTLGTGTVFASTTVSAADEGTTVTIALNAAALTFLNSNEGTSIALSGQDPAAPSSGPTFTTCAGTCRFFFTDTDPTGSGVFKQTPEPTLTLGFAAAVVEPTIAGVVNGASGQAGMVPNSWVTIFGSNLAPQTDDWSKSIVNGQFPVALDGVSVTIGGTPAYVNYISAGQINVLAPDVGAGPLPVIVTTPTGTSTAFTVTSNQHGPAFFEWPNNQPVATRQDFTYAVKAGTFAGLTTVAAKPGEVVILWGTGFGPTNPVAPEGTAVPSDQTYSTTTLPTVTVNDVPATVYGAALAPGFGGLYQVAIQVPDSITDGDWPILATIGGVQSPAGVLLSVHQ